MNILYGKFAPRYLKLYPGTNSTEASMAYNAHYRDTSRVSSWLYGSKWVKTAKSPFYTYYWDHSPPGIQGSPHMSEIVYCLNNLNFVLKQWTSTDYAIAEKMSSYWVNFAKTGDPNKGESYTGSENLVQWNPTVPEKQLTMHVGDGWGDVPLAEPTQVELISEFFSTQKPF